MSSGVYIFVGKCIPHKLKTLAFLCNASQSVCCFEFSHNLTIWVYCGSSGTCAANVQARRRATGNCRKERPLASNRSERDFGLAHPPLPGMGRYEEKAPMSNHPMNKGLLAYNSQCRFVDFSTSSSQMQLEQWRSFATPDERAVDEVDELFAPNVGQGRQIRLLAEDRARRNIRNQQTRKRLF